MRACLIPALAAACGLGGGEPADEAPESFFTLASSGDLPLSLTFDGDSMSATRASDGGDGCEGSWRGVSVSTADGLFASLRFDGCAIFSAGGPPTSVPARLEITSPSGDRFNSSYFDGQLGEEIDGCVAAIAATTRWEGSPFIEDHLFVTGTYTCAELYAGFGEDDPVALVQPGSFTFDWSSSAP